MISCIKSLIISQLRLQIQTNISSKSNTTSKIASNLNWTNKLKSEEKIYQAVLLSLLKENKCEQNGIYNFKGAKN